MTWQFPHRMLACYGMLPAVHEWPLPRLLDACSPWDYPCCREIAERRGYRLTVCDLEPREASVEEQRLGGLTYEDGTFRGVVSCDTLEHVEDMDGAARELRRVTEAGGFLILCLPVCFLPCGGKRQVTARAEPGHPAHHVWLPGMDMEQRVCAAGYRTVAQMECFDFGKMRTSALWLMEAVAQ